MLVFACLVPHAPILLPGVGGPDDKKRVKKTVLAMEKLSKEFRKIDVDMIIVSSPHPDWGIEVPLKLLAAKIELKVANYQGSRDVSFNSSDNVYPILTSMETVSWHYEKGGETARNLPKDKKIAWLASGDLSHTLKAEGPYGFNPAGPSFDKKFVELLTKKDIDGMLSFDNGFLAEAGVCGIWSFAMCLGALKELAVSWEPKILSYEGPLGVGYLVADLRPGKARQK